MSDDEGARPVALSRRRSAIGRHMRSSLAASAQLTCGVRVELDQVMAVREAWSDVVRESIGTGLSPLAFVARCACLVLQKMPLFNSTFDPDTGGRVEHEHVNLGIAVDTEDGLVVANIKQADGFRTVGLAAAIMETAKKVRSGRAKITDVTGGTFTISNTGSRGSAFDTPILNWPEVAIMAVPTIRREPQWEDDVNGGRFVPRWSTTLCLTYDHQFADGADAARFMTAIGDTLMTWNFKTEIQEELRDTNTRVRSAH